MRTSIKTYLYIISIFTIGAFLSSCSSNVTDSSDNLSKSKTSSGFENIIDERVNPEILNYSQPVGSADVEISDTGNPNSSGSVSVTYENEKVTVYYSSTWTPQDVANTFNYNINNDPDIDLTSSVDYSTATLTLTAYGTSGVAYVTHTNGTHITAFPYQVVFQ